MEQPSVPEEIQAHLARLAQRPGIQSTLALHRVNRGIFHSSGLLAEDDFDEDDTQPAAANGTYANGAPDTEKEGAQAVRRTRKAEEVADVVFKLIETADTLSEKLNGGADKSKLLRIRTGRVEVVIVPDSKYVLVGIHDTPPA